MADVTIRATMPETMVWLTHGCRGETRASSDPSVESQAEVGSDNMVVVMLLPWVCLCLCFRREAPLPVDFATLLPLLPPPPMDLKVVEGERIRVVVVAC